MVYIVVILVVLVADLIIKAKILEIPEAGFPIEKFKGKVKIVRTFNEGMAANVLDEDPAKVKKISSLVLVIFLILSLPLFFSKKRKNQQKAWGSPDYRGSTFQCGRQMYPWKGCRLHPV
jgi:lipoprotein signal peptidase